MSKNIFVFVEQRENKIQHVGLELLGEAKKLAAELGQAVVAVLIGSKIEDKTPILFEYGADRVILINHPILTDYVTEPYTKALSTVIKKHNPEIVLLGATSIGRDLAPRVAGRIHTGLTADCTNLKINPDTKLLEMTRPAFGGNLMATIVCREFRPQMATVRPGIMKTIEPNSSNTGDIIKMEINFTSDDMNLEIIKKGQNLKISVDITNACSIVSGGRAVGSAKGYEQLQDLANELNGEVATSRVGVINGWMDKNHLVGLTGKTVKPQLYIACGISGAIQHLAGMENSEYIIAINTDPDAPIMKIADLGIVGDIKQIIPKLTKAVRQFKSNKINL